MNKNKHIDLLLLHKEKYIILSLLVVILTLNIFIATSVNSQFADSALAAKKQQNDSKGNVAKNDNNNKANAAKNDNNNKSNGGNNANNNNKGNGNNNTGGNNTGGNNAGGNNGKTAIVAFADPCGMSVISAAGTGGNNTGGNNTGGNNTGGNNTGGNNTGGNNTGGNNTGGNNTGGNNTGGNNTGGNNTGGNNTGGNNTGGNNTGGNNTGGNNTGGNNTGGNNTGGNNTGGNNTGGNNTGGNNAGGNNTGGNNAGGNNTGGNNAGGNNTGGNNAGTNQSCVQAIGFLNNNALLNYVLGYSNGGNSDRSANQSASSMQAGSLFATAGANEFKAAAAAAYALEFKAYGMGLQTIYLHKQTTPPQIAANLAAASQTPFTPEAEVFMKVAAFYKGSLVNNGNYNNQALKNLVNSWGRPDLTKGVGVGKTDVETIAAVVQAINQQPNPATRQAWLSQIYTINSSTPANGVSPSGAVEDLHKYKVALAAVNSGLYDQLLQNFATGVRTNTKINPDLNAALQGYNFNTCLGLCVSSTPTPTNPTTGMSGGSGAVSAFVHNVMNWLH